MADFSSNKKYNYNWQNSKFKNLALSGSYISQFINDAGYVTSSVAISASYALTASYLSGTIASASYATSASYALTASYFGGTVTSASYALTASYVKNSVSASYATQALSASYAPSTPAFPYTGSALITGSLGVTGSIDATKIWSYGPGSITSNTAFGSNALNANTTGANNTAFGVNALITNTNGGQNTAVGWGAIQLTTGAGNTAIGYGAGQLNAGGTYNTYLGYAAGQLGTTAIAGVFIGYQAGSNSNATNAICIGYTAGTNAGNGSIAIGYGAGPGTGTHNFSVGQGAGLGMTTGNFNMHLGYRTVGSGVTTGNYNTLVGGDIVVGNVSNNAVLADMQGNIAIRKDANHYVGIGYTGSATLGAKLDIKAQGALSTDYALRVRNSVDTKDLLLIRGNGDHEIGATGSPSLSLIASSGFSYPGLTFIGQGGTEKSQIYMTSNRMTFLHTTSNTATTTMNTTGIAVGFGDTGASARIDIKAQGALSTDLALRVRNSANNDNILVVKGDQSIDFLGAGTGGYLNLSRNGGNVTLKHRATAVLPSQFIISSYGDGGSIGQIIFDTVFGTNAAPVFTMQKFISGLSDLTGSALYTPFGSNAAVFVMKNALNYAGYGIAPTGTATDHFAMYSADVNGVNGTASPNFRTEDGSVLWLGTQSKLYNVTASSIVASGSITVGNITSAPSNENTLNVYPPSAGGTGEGGQILLAASGGLYTSASMLDNWQNQFRLLKGTNTGGSTAGLVYVDLQSGNTQFVGAVTASAYSGLPNDYLYVTRNTNQTIGSGTWADRDIIFNNSVVSKGITYNTGTGLATLTGGKVYRITSRLAWSAAATYLLQYSCYNSSNTILGPTVEIVQSTNASNNISDGTLDFIYAPVSNVDIKIRTTNNTSALSGEFIRGDLNTQLIIQQIA